LTYTLSNRGIRLGLNLKKGGEKMLTLNEFIRKTKHKDIEGNRTYLYVTINGRKYGQSYQNQAESLDDMYRKFACFYYPFEQEREECDGSDNVTGWRNEG